MKSWKVVYTKPRSEKKVAERLNAKSFETFCPIKREYRQWSDRKKWVEFPLFTSYCFVLADENDTFDVLSTPGIVNYVYWLGKPAVVREGEMEALMRVLSDYEGFPSEVQQFSINDRIRIESGPFSEQDGSIFRQRKNVIEVILTELNLRLTVDLNFHAVRKLA